MNEALRRRIAAVLLLAGVIVAALAIADVGPFSDPPTEEERAQEAVERIFAAAGEGEFAEFCGLMTKVQRERFLFRASAVAAARELRGCPKIAKATLGSQFDGVSVAIKQVSVSGPQARVEANLKFAGEAGHQPRTISLEQVDGEWLVSEL